MNQMMENKQALFCPLEQNIQKLGTILSITPLFGGNIQIQKPLQIIIKVRFFNFSGYFLKM
jgi:hypothetical protein